MAETPEKKSKTTYRCQVLGVGISLVNMASAIHRIDTWIRRREPHYVCISGVHGVMESQRQDELKRIHNSAGMVTPDGMPMVWANWMHGNFGVRRVYGPSLMRNVCSEGLKNGYRHFLYGGGDGVADKLAAKLTEDYPGIQIVGKYTPPFRPLTPEEDADVIKQINESGADIVWVGLSTPKQEYWMSQHIRKLQAPVMVGVGAAFDFLAGLKSQAPRWMQPLGLEWFYRMVTEPKRLAKRYLTNNPLFCWYMLLETLRLRNFKLDDRRIVDVVEQVSDLAPEMANSKGVESAPTT